MQAFQRVVQAIDEGVEGVEDEARMRDLAFLSMARTYYSACIRLDENNTPTIDGEQAVGGGEVLEQGGRRAASTGSTRSSRSRGRTSWPATTRTRSATSTRSRRRTSRTRSTRRREILKAVIYFANCNYDDATTVVAKFKAKYEPVKKDLENVLTQFKGENQEEPFFKFLKEVRAGKANLPPTIKPVVEASLSDRQLLRNLEYVRVLDEEDARFKKAPGTFQSSPLGGDVQDGLQLARDLAIRNAGKLARERYQRTLDELNEHLRDCGEDPHRHHRGPAQPARPASRKAARCDQADGESLRCHQARRRARHLAVRRRVLA